MGGHSLSVYDRIGSLNTHTPTHHITLLSIMSTATASSSSSSISENVTSNTISTTASTSTWPEEYAQLSAVQAFACGEQYLIHGRLREHRVRDVVTSGGGMSTAGTASNPTEGGGESPQLQASGTTLLLASDSAIYRCVGGVSVCVGGVCECECVCVCMCECVLFCWDVLLG
jgi:hypothetical protein